MKRTLILTVAGLTAVGTLAFGGNASAASNDNPTPTGERAAQVCRKLDQINDAAARHLEAIDARIARLQTNLETATAAGRTKVAARLEKAIAAANTAKEKAQMRLDQVNTWAVENCPAT